MMTDSRRLSASQIWPARVGWEPMAGHGGGTVACIRAIVTRLHNDNLIALAEHDGSPVVVDHSFELVEYEGEQGR